MVEETRGLEEVKKDPFNVHEVLDRTYLIATMLDDHVLQHPWVKLNNDISTKVEEALHILADVYAEVGKCSHDLETNTDSKV